MQAVGGVKGGQYWSLGTIYRHVSRAIELAVNSTVSGRRPVLTGEELERLNELAPANPDTDLEVANLAGGKGEGKERRGFPLRMGWRGEGGVNFRDLYYLDGDEEDSEEGNGKDKRKGTSTGTVPAQLIYEPAECRRFFTMEMMFRPAKMWEVAREVMFGDSGERGCVGGSETRTQGEKGPRRGTGTLGRQRPEYR